MNSSAILCIVLAGCFLLGSAFGGRSKIVSEPANGGKSDIDKSVKQEETHLTVEDFEHAKKVEEKDNSGDAIDPTDQRRPDLFEGDIKGIKERSSQYRNGIRDKSLKWPNGRVPYSLSSQYGPNSRATIAAAMDEYAKRTCVRFVPRTSERDYIFITPDDGCYSLVGRDGGRQILSLDNGCIEKGIIIHELMHSLGFFHEQSRPDRDQYITVHYENIERGFADQFEKLSSYEVDLLQTQYDYGSIMHYGRKAFSRNYQDTIVPKQSGVSIGQRRGFSDTDITKVKRLYQCDGGVNPGPGPGPAPSPGPSCDNKRTDCDFLKNFGYCTNSQVESFMSTNCRKTCNKCDGGNPGPINPPPSCSDKNSQCQSWKRFCNDGFFSQFLASNCPRSCNKC